MKLQTSDKYSADRTATVLISVLRLKYLELAKRKVMVLGTWFNISPDRLYIVFRMIDRKSELYNRIVVSIWKQGEWQDRVIMRLDEQELAEHIRKLANRLTGELYSNAIDHKTSRHISKSILGYMKSGKTLTNAITAISSHDHGTVRRM